MTWWLVHGLTGSGLIACIALAYGASRRIGSRTAYGQLLLVYALGFWLLFCAFLLWRAHEIVMGTNAVSGNLGDVIALTGWTILTGAFYLFTLRFPRARCRSLWHRALVPLAHALPPAILMVFLYTRVLVPGARLDSVPQLVQVAYLFVDGLAIGIVAAGVERLYRFRASTLGRLFLGLGFALVLNAVADVAWNWFNVRGGKPLIVDVAYAASSLLAMSALAYHYADVARRDAQPERFADPTLSPSQRVLRDIVHQVKGLAGDYGEFVTLTTATEVLSREGVPHRVEGDVVEADADEATWQRVLTEVRDRVLSAVGDGAHAPLENVAAAYGEPFAFLKGGRAA